MVIEIGPLYCVVEMRGPSLMAINADHIDS